MTEFRIQPILILLLACTCFVKVNAGCTGQDYTCSLAEEMNQAAQNFGGLVDSLVNQDAVEKGLSIVDGRTLGHLRYGLHGIFFNLH